PPLRALLPVTVSVPWLVSRALNVSLNSVRVLPAGLVSTPGPLTVALVNARAGASLARSNPRPTVVLLNDSVPAPDRTAPAARLEEAPVEETGRPGGQPA